MNSDSRCEVLKQEDIDIDSNDNDIKTNIPPRPQKQEEEEPIITSNLPPQPPQQEEPPPITSNLPPQPSTQKEPPRIITSNPPPQTINSNPDSNPSASLPNSLSQPSPPPQQPPPPPPLGIFLYGTLLAPEFISWVLTGSASNHSLLSSTTHLSLRQPAILRSYRRVAVIHADYPALIPGNEFDHVEGFLVTPATRSQWKKLDDFEGESYRKEGEVGDSEDFEKGGEGAADTTTALNSANTANTASSASSTNTTRKVCVPAFVYLWQDSMDELLLDQDWDYDYFREHRLEDWLDLFEGMEMVGDDDCDSLDLDAR